MRKRHRQSNAFKDLICTLARLCFECIGAGLADRRRTADALPVGFIVSLMICSVAEWSYCSLQKKSSSGWS